MNTVPFDNILTALWGMVAFVGASVTFILPKTKDYFERYLDSAKETDREIARNWIQVVRLSPVVVLIIAVLLSISAAVQDHWAWAFPGDTNFWLLTLTVATQAAFVAVVWLLVGRPPAPAGHLEAQPLTKLAGLKSEPGGRATSIRFTNTAVGPVTIVWINYQGSREPYETLQRNETVVRRTWVGHPFVVVSEGNHDVGLFMPSEEPASVTITPSMVNAADGS